MAGALTQLRHQAQQLAERGRQGDTELVHMSPREVATLHALHPDGELPRNPDTGLPEAFDLGGVLGAIGGALLPIIAPGIGDAVGGALGIGSEFGGALTGALGGGALGALGSLIGGGKNPLLYGGLGALGGGLTGYFGSDINSALGTEGGLLSSLFGGSSPSSALSMGFGDSGGAAGELANAWNDASTGAGGTAGFGSLGGTAGASGSSWLGRNWPLLGAGLLAAGALGSSSKKATATPTQTAEQQRAAAQNATPAKNFEFVRNRVPTVMDPTQWYTLGNQRSGQPVLFFDRPAGEYREVDRPITGLARGGMVRAPWDSYLEPNYWPVDRALDDRRPMDDDRRSYADGGLASMRSRYVAGDTGGQADAIPARLSDGEFVMDATTVSDAGDGNSNAGAREFEKLRQEIRRRKGRKRVVPPKAGKLISYMDGGSA